MRENSKSDQKPATKEKYARVTQHERAVSTGVLQKILDEGGQVTSDIMFNEHKVTLYPNYGVVK